VYEKTNFRDGYVSLEVSPFLAHDTQATMDEARRLWKAVGRENLMVKVPATPEGVPAIEQLLSEGWVWVLLAPLVPFVYLYNSLVAMFTRKITWRGIRYELISPLRTRIIAR